MINTTPKKSVGQRTPKSTEFKEDVVPLPPATARWRQLLKRIGRSRSATFGLIVIIVLILMTIFGPLVAPYDPYQYDFHHAREGPSLEHWMGTDIKGRDLLSRVICGAQISMFIGCTAIGMSVSIGLLLGMVAAYRGKFIDNLIMRSLDILMAFPGIILALVILAFLGRGTLNVALVIGIVMIPLYARIIRSQVLSIKETEYITAAKSIGVSDFVIMFRHILPNCFGPLLVIATLGIGGAIMADAALAFIGLGAAPPTPSWGLMVSEGFKSITSYPHITMFPSLAIMVAVLGFNMFGDGIRDIFDPKLQTRGQ